MWMGQLAGKILDAKVVGEMVELIVDEKTFFKKDKIIRIIMNRDEANHFVSRHGKGMTDLGEAQWFKGKIIEMEIK